MILTNSHTAGVGSSNNYAYLVSDEATKDAVIIDPANPPEYVLTATTPSSALTFAQSRPHPQRRILEP